VDFGLRFWLNLDFSAPYSSLNYIAAITLALATVLCTAKGKGFDSGNQIPIPLLAGIISPHVPFDVGRK